MTSYPTYLLFILLLSGCVKHAYSTPAPPTYLQHNVRQVNSSTSVPTSNSTSNTTKAGLAWANGNTVDIKQYLTTGKVSWYYSWSAFPITGTTLEFVPMLWGTRSTDDFTRNVNNQTIMKNRVRAILGMNEPEQPGQSNLTAAEGAEMWKTYLEPLKSANTSLRLGSPASSSAPSGKTWLQDFFTACNGSCSVDFVALHWYGTNATQFQTYIQDFHTTFPNHTLWITEWACQNYVDVSSQCSADQVTEFMNTTQQFLDEQDYVERYAWFGAMRDMQGVNPDNALMDRNGRINALGSQYIGSGGTATSEAPFKVIPFIQVSLGVAVTVVLGFLQ